VAAQADEGAGTRGTAQGLSRCALGSWGAVGAASVSQAAARSWMASEQHRAHYRGMQSRGAAQRRAGIRACGAEMWREKT
jgi:hypothetical protein